MDNILKYILYAMVSLVVLWLIFAFVMANSKFLKTDLALELPENLPVFSEANPAVEVDMLRGTKIYTFLANTIDKWVYFDFSRGSVASDVSSMKDPNNWDLAFRMAKIVSNGGATNKTGKVAVAKLATTDFDSVKEVPENVKFLKEIKPPNSIDTRNDSFENWSSYKPSYHEIKPYDNFYLIKTSEGKFAKMQILSYYCKKGVKKIKGCYTIKYVYQGGGTKSLTKIASQMKKTG